MKILFYTLWIICILVGAFTVKLIPDVYHYLYGFVFGSFSFMFLQLSKEDW